MKQLRCRDAGFDCDHVIEAETAEEVLQQAAEHVQSVHNLTVTAEIAEQVSGLIYNKG
jgi:predicted small metal-binding protein